MQTVWTQHLPDPDAKKDFQSLLLNSTQVLGRFKELLEGREKAILNFETSVDSYDNPSWAFKQAHANGRRAELKELKDLLNFIK